MTLFVFVFHDFWTTKAFQRCLYMQNEYRPRTKGRETSENFTPRSGRNVNGMKSQMINDALLGQGTFVRNDEKLFKNIFGSKLSHRGTSRVESPQR